MYEKCGNIDKAHKLFDSVPQRNLVSSNAMIEGYEKMDLFTNNNKRFVARCENIFSYHKQIS